MYDVIMSTSQESARVRHSVSVVVPVYLGSQTLGTLLEEIRPFINPTLSPGGVEFQVKEVVLVNDCGPDGSEHTIRDLALQNDWVKPVWLSKNYGQHAATLAGMAATTSEWIITIDEDGQQNPTDFGNFLDTAVANDASLVYAKPTNRPPHGILRNTLSWIVKNTLFRMLTDGVHTNFNSFRLVSGTIGRTLAAYVGDGVYLDVALTWMVQNVAQCPVQLRQETRSKSGYSFRQLSSHFWRLVLSAGTRPLRLAALMGVTAFITGIFAAATIVIGKVNYGYAVSGWASLFAALMLIGGLILLVLGVLAEYLGMIVRASIGKPLYVTIGDPELTALRRSRDSLRIQ